MSAISDPRPDFYAGEEAECGGVRYRVINGRKPPKNGNAPGHDLVLQILTPSGWVSVGMGLGALLADFHFQIEDYLYDRRSGFKGGNKYFDHLRRAVRNGWRFAVEILEAEKRQSKAPTPKLFEWNEDFAWED